MPTIKVTTTAASPPAPDGPDGPVKRRGTTLVVTFSPSAGAARQLVSVRLSDRVRQGLVLGPRARGFSLKGIPRGIHASSIVIRGRSAEGVPGPAAAGTAAERRPSGGPRREPAEQG